MDLTEAEDIKKRWQEYKEELYKKDLNNRDNHNGVITDWEPDILECKVKWALGSITMNKAAAAAAKSLQSCTTLGDPIDGSPPGSPIPGILQARTLEWVAISFSNAWKWKMKVKSLSQVRLVATTWTAAHEAPLSMGFFQARVLEWGAIAFSDEQLVEVIEFQLSYFRSLKMML